jgi:hypothetical protein
MDPEKIKSAISLPPLAQLKKELAELRNNAPLQNQPDEIRTCPLGLTPTCETVNHMDRESLIAELGKLAHREHYNCEEDTFYGCPLSRDGCSDDRQPKVCNCGADAHNAKVAALLKVIEETKP